MNSLLKEMLKKHRNGVKEVSSWLFVSLVVVGGVLLIAVHASASTSGKMRLYFHKENSDANETYNSLSLSPAEPAADTSTGSIGFVQSKSTATATATFTSAPVQNHLLVAYVYSSSSTAITMTSTGWTAGTSCAAGNGQSTRAGRLFWKIAGASESSTVTAASGNNISVAEYSGIDTTTPLDGTAAGTAENFQANASGTNTTPSVTPVQGRQVLVIIGLGVRSTSATYSAQAITGTNVGTVNLRENPGTTNASSMLGDTIVGSTIDAHQGSATPSANAVGCGSIGIFEAASSTSSTNTNATPATSFCEASNNTADNITAMAVDSGTVANRCVGTFISQPLVGPSGGTIALSTGDTASVTGQFWSLESSTTITTALNAYIYRWNGTGTTLTSTDRIATLTCADPGATITSCTPTAVSPANNVTFNAGDRLVVIISLNVTATVASSTASAYFDNSSRTGSYVQMSYTTYGYNSSNKPTLSGSLDDDFTTDSATTACTTAGVTYNTKWTCQQGSAVNTAGNFNAGTTSGTINGDSSGWLWLQNQTTSTAATASNFGSTPSNTFLYQTLPSAGYSDGNITTVVNASSLYDIGPSATASTSPYTHAGIVLWASNTDYLEVQLYSDGAINGTGTNNVHVALNNSGTISGAQNLNTATTGNRYSNIWLRINDTGGSYQAQYSTDGTTFTNVGSAVSHGAFSRTGLNVFADIANPTMSYGAGFEWFNSTLGSLTYNQTGFEFFDNANSTTPGTAHGNSTNYTLTSTGAQFRLRQLIKSSGSVAASNSFSEATVDSTGKDVAMALGTDGFARIAYYDATNQHLKFAQCTNAACTTSNITTVDSGTQVGQYPSMVLGTDGFARIAYYDATNQHLKYAQCTNDACTTSNLTTLDSGTAAGQYTSIALGSDGFARIAYNTIVGPNLKFIQCTNSSCSTSNVATVQTATGNSTSIAMGNDGFARIAYEGSSSGPLKYAQCTNDACSTSTQTIIDSGVSLSSASEAIAVASSDGFARMVYVNAVSGDVKFAQCVNSACTSPTITTLVTAVGSAGNSIVMASDGFARIAYRASNLLKFIVCTNDACSASSSTTLQTDAGGFQSQNNATSLALDAGNNPYVAYYTGSSDNLSSPTAQFKLQFAPIGASCSSASYSDVSASSVIKFYDNATPGTGDAITYQSGTDPTDTGQTVSGQTYQEANSPFVSPNAWGNSVDGEWDFSLTDNSAPASTAYCFRLVQGDGTAFTTYTNYPVITTFGSASPTTDQILRGGEWFNNGSKQPLFWAN